MPEHALLTSDLSMPSFCCDNIVWCPPAPSFYFQQKEGSLSYVFQLSAQLPSLLPHSTASIIQSTVSSQTKGSLLLRVLDAIFSI